MLLNKSVMKSLFFFVAISLLLIGCGSDENIINEPEIPNHSSDSFIQVDDMALRGYVFEGYYYIEAVDAEKNVIFTIKDKAEDYVHDRGFGEKEYYTVDGCYLLDAFRKNNNLYVFVSLYDKPYHPHKFILKIQNGEVIRKVYFDSDDYHNHLFFPERMINWYGEYIAIYITPKTSYNDMAILDENLNYTDDISWSGIDIWVENIEKNNYILFSPNNIIYTVRNTVVCADMSKYEYITWETRFTEEEIRLIKADYSLEGNNVAIDVSAITKAGENKKYHLVLNKDTGEIVS